MKFRARQVARAEGKSPRDINAFGAHLSISSPSAWETILKNAAYAQEVRAEAGSSVFLVRGRLRAMNFLRHECTKVKPCEFGGLGIPNSEYVRATDVEWNFSNFDVLFYFSHLSCAMRANWNVKL